jgi:hypothetical protein
MGLSWWKVLPRNVQNAARNLSESAQQQWRNTPQTKVPKANRHKNKSSDDVPSWARNYRPNNGEDGKAFARRVCDENLESGYPTGSSSPFNQIKKWGTRDFQRTPLPASNNSLNYPSSPFFEPVTYDPWVEPPLI